ncbi:hypothetical protein GA0115257_123720 [Streptomyces sp. LcepLS]|nr:hypothetical protein GA0115257_123720 [Streptomyces sp. LcepLS]
MTAEPPPLMASRWRGRRVVSVWLPRDGPEAAPDGGSGGTGGESGPGRRCGACGRLLRRYSASGLGPVCERKLRQPRATIPPPAPEQHIPGQTELPIDVQTALTWSL